MKFNFPFFFFLSCFWCKLWEVNLERTISQCECEDRGDSVSWLRSHHGGDLQACLMLSAWPSKCAVGMITLLPRVAGSDTKNSTTGSFSIKGTRKTCTGMKCTRNEMSLTWTWDSHFTSWWIFHNSFYSNIFVILKSVIEAGEIHLQKVSKIWKNWPRGGGERLPGTNRMLQEECRTQGSYTYADHFLTYSNERMEFTIKKIQYRYISTPEMKYLGINLTRVMWGQLLWRMKSNSCINGERFHVCGQEVSTSSRCQFFYLDLWIPHNTRSRPQQVIVWISTS